MVRTPRTARRPVGVLAVLALVAVGLGGYATSPAGAATPRLLVDNTFVRAAAGTCTVITVTPADSFGVPSSAPDTVTVLLSETPSSSSQDLDFCTTTADTPSEDPSYVNGADFALNQTQTYKAGPGVTGNGFSSGGAPDRADSSRQPAPNSSPDGGSFATTNPSGVDRARYLYTPGSGGIRVGVVGLTAGSGTVRAFFDQGRGANAGNYTIDSDEVAAQPVTFTVTDGGQPGSPEAAAAVTKITLDPADGVGPPNAVQSFTARLTNSSGDTVRGIRPGVEVAANGANPRAPASCDESDNSGISRCTFLGTNPGQDNLFVFVNLAGGSAGRDPNEVTAVTQRTTTKAAVPAANARYIDVTPTGRTTTAGDSAVFTATVTDVDGAPAQNVQVTFAETGPGRFQGGSSTLVGFTDVTGRLQVTVQTAAGSTGDQTITATITTNGTQCSQQAGAGTGSTSSTPAGRCSDTVTHRIVAASASPSPSPSRSATPTPSQTASATPTATMSSTPSPACQTAQVTVNTPTVNATGLASVTVFGAVPNSRVELQGYSQDHFGSQNFDNDPTPVDRAGTTDSSGTLTFNDLRPSSNTRVRARQVGCAYGDSAVVEVRTTIFLKVTRDGPRTYTFAVDSIPARPGGLIVSIYRIAGRTCPAGVEPRDCPGEPYLAQTRVSSIDGTGSRTLRFDSSFGGREQFVLKTGRDAQNAPGRSNVRDLAIF